MRLFLAIEIPNDIKDYISQIQESFNNNGLRLVNLDRMHLTLKFLGEVQLNKINIIKEKLNKIKFNNFSIFLDKIGFFPNEKYIKVIWIGLKPEKEILQLQKNIDENLKILFKKDKNFKGHVTIARVKFIENKKDFIEKLKTIAIEKKEIKVENFKLIKSTLTPEGPIYEELEVFKA